MPVNFGRGGGRVTISAFLGESTGESTGASTGRKPPVGSDVRRVDMKGRAASMSPRIFTPAGRGN
jgi:hypothetical protein